MKLSQFISIHNDVDSSNNKEKFSCKQYATSKFPIVTWLPQCTRKSVFHDILAGFTVALTEIPQSIAYADIAGLPLQYGLYSSFMGSFMYAIFGTCQAVNMGATSLMALMIQPHVSALGPIISPVLSFITGTIIFIAGLLRLGFVIDFFSYPIIAGFTSAAALTIASAQIGNFLGIEGQSDDFLEAWELVFTKIAFVKKWDIILGFISLIMLIVLKEIKRFSIIRLEETPSKIFIKRCILFISIARNAIIVLLTSLLAFILKENGIEPFRLSREVSSGLPSFEFPFTRNGTVLNFNDMITECGASLGFIPLIAVLESIAVAKVFSNEQVLDASQEMIALGVANFAGSFFGSMPVTSSFSRTAVNNASGAKSNLAGVITGLIILLTLGFLTSTFAYIPKASLAAVIICAMFYIIEFEAIILLWRTKKLEILPFVITLLCCLFISLEYGILIGILTNLIFILYSVSRPKLFIERRKLENHPNEEVYLLITPKTTIYFLAAEFLKSTVLKCENEGNIIVFNGKYIGNIDVTVAKSLAALANQLLRNNKKIVFLNFKQSVRDVCINIDQKLINNFRMGELEVMFEGTAFSVEWQNVALQDRPSEGEFTFQTTLHQNGVIVFVYNNVPDLSHK